MIAMIVFTFDSVFTADDDNRKKIESYDAIEDYLDKVRCSSLSSSQLPFATKADAFKQGAVRVFRQEFTLEECY
jgi:hypothetical protein